MNCTAILVIDGWSLGRCGAPPSFEVLRGESSSGLPICAACRKVLDCDGLTLVDETRGVNVGAGAGTRVKITL